MEVGKSLIFVVKMEVELVLRFLSAGAFSVIITMDWVVPQLLEFLEKVTAGKILVLVVEVEVEVKPVQRSLSAGVSSVIVSMDSVLLSLPKLDRTVGMALQVVVTVGMFSMSGSLSLEVHLHFQPQLPQVPGYSLPQDLDPRTSSLQLSQLVANSPLRDLNLCSLDWGSLPQRAWLLLPASGRDRVPLSPPRIWLGMEGGDILCRSGGRRCSGWQT